MLTMGCDSGGSGMEPPAPSDPPAVEPPADPLSVAIVSPAASYRPGAALELAVQGADIEAAVVTARIGARDVLITPLRPDTLGMLLPAVEAGDHTLTVEVEGETADVALTVASTDVIDDPEAYVKGKVEARAAAIRHTVDTETDPAVRAAFDARADALTNALSAWDALSPDEQVAVAYMVQEALATAEDKAATAAKTQCVASGFASKLKQLTIGATVFALAIEGGTVSLATAQPWWAAGFGILGALGGAAFLDAALDLKAMVPGVLNCVFASAIDVLGLEKNGTARLAFTHGVSETLAIQTGFSLNHNVIFMLSTAKRLMNTYADYVPSSWLDAFDVPTEKVWEAGAPADLALENLSTSTINGTLSRTEEQVSLTFRYVDADNQPSDAELFTFMLVSGGNRAVVEATLEPRSFEHNYALEIGNYHPDYSRIEPRQTIEPDQNLTLANYMTYMVRVTLDGVPVRVGEFGFDWMQYGFGETPTSGNDVVVNDHVVRIWDATHNRWAEVPLETLRLTNRAYDLLVGKSFTIKRYANGEWTGVKTIRFDADGTYTSANMDGSGSQSAHYNWRGDLVTPYLPDDCTYGIIQNEYIGAVHIGSLPLPGVVLHWLTVYEDGSVGPNIGCNLKFVPR